MDCCFVSFRFVRAIVQLNQEITMKCNAMERTLDYKKKKKAHVRGASTKERTKKSQHNGAIDCSNSKQNFIARSFDHLIKYMLVVIIVFNTYRRRKEEKK